MTKSIFFLVLTSLTATIFVYCSRSDKEKLSASPADTTSTSDSLQPSTGATAAVVAVEPKFKVNETFQQQLADVFTSYLTLKDAFVSSDSVNIPSKSNGISKSLNKVELKLLSGQALNEGKKYLPSLERSLKEIQSSTNIEKQRRAFSTLSDSLYITIKAFGLGGKQAFYKFCPMAFNEEGAFWLSDQEKIRNPYFGDKMLTCGEVKEKLN